MRTGLVWSMAIAGGMPSMRSTARLVHAVEELARVRREGLDVAALAFGVQRVEHQRGLARARHAGHHDELAQRDVEVEVLADCSGARRECGCCRASVWVMVGGARPGRRAASTLPRFRPDRRYFRRNDDQAGPGSTHAVLLRPDAARDAVLRAVQPPRALDRRGRPTPSSNWCTNYADDDARRAELIQRIGEIERSADKVTHETVSLLHKTFITPFDRDQIHRLITSMDDILDLIQDAAESMQLYDMQHAAARGAAARRPAAARAASKVQDAVALLRSMDNAPGDRSRSARRSTGSSPTPTA